MTTSESRMTKEPNRTINETPFRLAQSSAVASCFRVSFLPRLFVACLVLIVVLPVAALAQPNPGEPRSKRKSTSPAAPKRSAPGAGASKSKTADDADKSSDERRKLSDLNGENALPYLRDLAVPTVQQLHDSQVDWLVLKGPFKDKQRVVVVKQVFPRPDTLKKLEAALEELRRQPAPTTAVERAKRLAQRNELSSLVVMLPSESEGQLFEIPTNVIDSIIYHEDLIIRRAALLIDGGRFRDAFELLCPLAQQTPGWKGLTEETQRLMFLEAEQGLKSGDLESALTSLVELHVQNRDYPQLQTRLGEVVEKLILRSRNAGNYRESRHFLRRLSLLEPRHETVQKWTHSLGDEAQRLIDAADAAGQAGRHDEAVTLIDRAARVWPTAPGLGDMHRKLCARFQRLAVGVLTLPRQSAADGPGLSPTLSDTRERRLSQFDLFEVDRIDDMTHYRSRLIEQWEPTDLGRRAVFDLKTTRSRWESRPLVTATPILATMESRLDPSRPAYDERFAHLIDSLRVRSPFEYEVGFSRAPLRAELLFRFPVMVPGGAAQPERRSEQFGSGPGRVLSRRFERVRRTNNETVYRRVIAEPDGLSEYHVAEIVERRYDSPELAIQGLMRGEISMLPDQPTWIYSLVRGDPRFFVLDYAVPTTHVLQFNPQSAPLRSRELRLAMAFAIDTPQILSRIVLRDPTLQNGRLVTAPFATTSYAYNSLLAHRDFSAGMAASLHTAAVKRLKSDPVLRVLCDPELTARLASAEILKQWKRVGIHAELVTGDLSSSGSKWDVAYRTLRMEEPLVELWPFLTVDAGTRLQNIRHLPDWMREELLALDNAADWKSAVGRLQQLQAHLYAEVECIPLWETDDALVLRKNIRDFPAVKFVQTYQDVERWVVQSWYPEDEP
jgi:tetratricopeptide (TPR) repeat protein